VKTIKRSGIKGNFLVMDLETTGIDVYRHVPIQLAMLIKNSRGETLLEESIYIQIREALPQKIVEITGITSKTLVNYGKSPSAVAKYYADTVWKYRPLYLLGYNIVNFDYPMWQKFLFVHTLGRFKFPPVLGLIDVMLLVGHHFGTKKWLKLADAANKLKLPFNPNELHNALADIRLTWRVFDELRARGDLKWIGSV